MFTGLIQTLGTIKPIDSQQFILSEFFCHDFFSDLAIGDSVAVDGVCLTVESILADGFVAYASPETLQRTTLGTRSQAAMYVNLETSLRVGSKLGGHFVTGHVDSLGCLVESFPTENAWEMTFAAVPSLSESWHNYVARYLVSKGSISVNGISLTIADLDIKSNWFKAAVIPHSYSNTNLSYLKVGDFVNIECDILGKYVDKLLAFNNNGANHSEDISLDFLMQHGYY